jgi:hypothetical protein
MTEDNEYIYTLEELEQLPDRDRRTRRYIRSIGLRLKPLIRRGGRATALADKELLAEIKSQYAQIRGERGRPAHIDEYFVKGPGRKGHIGVNDACAEIIQQSRDLPHNTILRYFRRYPADRVALPSSSAETSSQEVKRRIFTSDIKQVREILS